MSIALHTQYMQESRSTGQLRQTWLWPDLWSWACYRRLGELSSRYHLPVDFFIAVHVGLTEKLLRNGIIFLLNSEPLSKITLYVLGYLDSHNPLNIWDIIAEYWSMIRNYAILNHPVAGSIKVMHNNWSSFVSILLSGCMTLASIFYVLMRSTHTVFHDVKVSEYLAGSNPYLELRFFNFW